MVCTAWTRTSVQTHLNMIVYILRSVKEFLLCFLGKLIKKKAKGKKEMAK